MKMQPFAVLQNAHVQFLCTGDRMLFLSFEPEKIKSGNGSNLELTPQYLEVVASGPTYDELTCIRVEMESTISASTYQQNFPCFLPSSSKFKVILYIS